MHRRPKAPPLPHFALFLFFLLSSFTTNAIHPNNTNISSCTPFSCGGQGPDIHYPFWIAQNSTAKTTHTNISSYCGYPSLQLACRDQTPVLRLPTGDYTVTDINYSSRINSLADLSVLQGPTTCRTAHKNVSFWANSSLHFTSSDTNLIFFISCSFSLPIPLIRCSGRGVGLSYLFWNGSEILMEDELVSRCEEVLVVPVLQAALEENMGVLFDAFGRVLQKGFELGWETEGGAECRSSERIGGSCSYRKTGAGDWASVCHHKDGLQEEAHRGQGARSGIPVRDYSHKTFLFNQTDVLRTNHPPPGSFGVAGDPAGYSSRMRSLSSYQGYRRTLMLRSVGYNWS